MAAIHEADNDGNPETISDGNWQPLVNNPNYPDYTSGDNNVTGAMTRALALFFGTDEMTFTVATTYPLAVQRTRNRMEEKGLVVSRLGDPTPQRGGRAKRYITVTKKGRVAVISAQRSYRSLLQGLGLLEGANA